MKQSDRLNSELSIRRAVVTDANAVHDLTSKAYSKWVRLIGRKPLPMQVDYTQAIQDHDIDLLFSEGILVGLIETVSSLESLLIENIAVHPDHQCKGYGGQLLLHAEALAHAQNIQSLRLYTNKEFIQNIEFYRNQGYSVDREETLKPTIIAVHMSKMI
ncbi:MAG: GNAT family N-acetyltransferase [Pseudomonadota bacterium]